MFAHLNTPRPLKGVAMSNRIQALGPFQLVFDHGPVMAGLSIFAVSWLTMNLIAIAIEHRLLVPSQQYPSFYYGDLIFLTTLAAVITANLHYLPATRGHWYQSPTWHWTVLLAAFAFGVLFHLHDKGAYTLAQWNSPTKLYHDFIVFAVIGYILVAAGIPVLTRVWAAHDYMVAVAMLGLVAGFIGTFLMDATATADHAHENFDYNHFNQSYPFISK